MRHAFILTLLVLCNGIESLRFLGLFPLPIESHFYMYEKLMKALVQNGHKVDVLSHFPQQTTIPRYNDLSISGSVPVVANNLSIEDAAYDTTFNAATFMFREYGRDLCKSILKHPTTIKLRNTNVKYDAIISEVFATDCLLGFVDLFGVPLIGITSSLDLPWGNERMGNPDDPSYVHNYFVPRSGERDLLYKIEIAFVSALSKIGYYLLSTIPSEMQAKKFFGKDMPPLNNIAHNTSLLLVNTHFSSDEARPAVPGFVEVGGLHIGKVKPLPQALKKFLKSSAGVIYFSMGTVLRMDTFGKDKLDAILAVFAKLPLKVVLKGKIDRLYKKIPKNVLVEDWVPQLDLLCNPKTRVFITHGGQLSVQEAVNCGVPILGIPLFANHKLTLSKFQTKRAGIRLDYSDITFQSFQYALNQLVYNASYKTNALKLSKIFKDRPTSAIQTAVFWTQYVARYEGACHLRSKSADLVWFEYYSLDVAILFIIVFVILTFLFFYGLIQLRKYFERYQTNPKFKQK